MSFLDKARSAFAQVTNEVSKGADYLSLQGQMGALATELDRALVEVGKRAWELSRQHKIQDPQLDVLVNRCNELDAKMVALREQVQEVQSRPTAPPPAVPAPPGPSAPPAAPVGPPPPPPAAQAASAHCTACGAELPVGAKFCGECGGKVD